MTELIKRIDKEIARYEQLAKDNYVWTGEDMFRCGAGDEYVGVENDVLPYVQALRVAIVALKKRDEWCNSLQGYDDGSDLSHEGKALFEIKEIMGVGDE